MRKTVIVCKVGGRATLVVNAIKQNKPDFVYFLCSAGDKAASSEGFVDQVPHRAFKGHLARGPSGV